MALTTSEVVAFVNADAIPCDADAVARLIEPLLCDPALGATFGRQVARPGAAPITHLDHRRAFGAGGAAPVRHGAFFSMAASAVRRDLWRVLRFDEQLRYSEDVDFTLRARALGWRSQYVPEACFEHSHDYDLQGQLKRRRGEGEAETAIFRLGRPSPFGELLRPLAGALLRDARAGLLTPRSVAIRSAQAVGFYLGRLESARSA
jgi:rhamnosyltransferase